MKKKLIFLGAIFASVALLIGAYFLFIVPKTAGSGEKTVMLEITAGSKAYSKQIKTNKEYVFDMLEEIKDDVELEYNTDWGSPFVTGFLGVTAEGDYWYAFFINKESSFMGVADAPITDGDTVSFILTSDWEPAYEGQESKLWIFLEIVGMFACIGLMAYMIAKDYDR